MMDCSRNQALLLFAGACFILLLEHVSSHVISPDALEANSGTRGRSMIQKDQNGEEQIIDKAPCKKVNFDKISYKPLRDGCKFPYRVAECCEALKKLACPYAEVINDMKTVCAWDMFWNINKWYPEGWFFDHCREGPHGLDCGTH